MYYAIDRFEGNSVVLIDDNRCRTTVLRSCLPAGCCQGDILLFENGSYRLCPSETAQRRTAVSAKEQRLRRKLSE